MHDVPNESSFHTARASREVLAREVKIMDAWTQALEYSEGEDAEKKDEDFWIEEGELELDLERAQVMEDTTQELVTRSVGQDLISAEMERWTSHCNAFLLAELLEDELIYALQVGYDATKNGVKTPLFNLVG